MSAPMMVAQCKAIFSKIGLGLLPMRLFTVYLVNLAMLIEIVQLSVMISRNHVF